MPPFNVVCVLGTRPEIIKFAPVVQALKSREGVTETIIVTGQQADLIDTFLASQQMAADHSLALMQPGEDFETFMRRTVAALWPLLFELGPDAVVVQGDTSTACAAAVTAAFLGIPVVHIEAGLRSGDLLNPYPEEGLRTLISHCASLHCAPTTNNVQNLLGEGIAADSIVLTGNPIVDAVNQQRQAEHQSATLLELLKATRGYRRVVMTCHRRENFGQRITDYFSAVADFIRSNAECTLVFPVHPNPNVQAAAADILGKQARIHLTSPLDYQDFLGLITESDLILSDSGGIQEECATLGVPLFVLRQATERPEILHSDLARLVPDGQALSRELSALSTAADWPARQTSSLNPFGDGRSGERIAGYVETFLMAQTATQAK